MRELLISFCAVLLFSLAFVSTEVTVENTGYSVLVSFSQNVPPEDGKALIEHVKASLQNASEVLRIALGFPFTSVTFKIPESWDTSEWEEHVGVLFNHNSPKTDIVVDSANDVVFGKLPFTVQHGSCGTPGHQLIIPTAFFNETNEFPRGTALAREWLKYRYGVFDENGYADDLLYPLYYRIPGTDPDEVKITECTDPELTYNFLDQNGDNCSTSDKPLIDQLNSKQCKIKIAGNDSYDVISSLMYFQEDISTMEHICGRDNHPHNSRAPNKQNALCHGKSIWDVVQNSKDFQTVPKEYSSGGEHAIEYTYVKEANPTVIVAWENTAALKENDKHRYIVFAIKKLVLDLPYGSKFAGFSLKSEEADVDYNIDLHDVKTIDDKRKIISINSDFYEKEPANVVNAISKIVDFLLPEGRNKDEVKGDIFIITTSNILEEDMSAIKGKLDGLHVCVNILHIREDSSEPEELINYLEDYTTIPPCGVFRSISVSETNEKMFQKLYGMMGKVLPTVVDNTGIETVKTEFLSQDSPISINIDDSVEDVTFWVFSQNEKTAFSVTLDGEDKTKDAIYEMYSDIRTLSYSPSKDGKVKLSLTREIDPILIQARTTSKSGKYFTGEIFVHDTSEENSSDQMPVIIYAVIRYGAYPIQNAKVLAVIERPDEKSITLELNDDGRGNPDVTKNDGIYSRYFTQFSKNGLYTVTVGVQSKGDATTYGVDENAGYQTCCGSTVKLSTPKLNLFTKALKTTFEARSGRPEDGYEPSRITDLRIGEVKDDKITLEWSAPGGEADFGKVSKYEIELFCGEENTTDCNIHEIVRILSMSDPEIYGKEQQVTIQILDRTHTLYIGIKTLNEMSKKSDLSNTVQIFKPSSITITSSTTEDTTATETAIVSQSAPQNGKIIGGVIAGILVLICIVGAIIYYFKRKSNKKNREVNEMEENRNRDKQEMKPNFTATDCSDKSASVKKTESFPVLLYTHDQIRDCKEKGKDEPLYANIPSKQWKSLDVISNVRKDDKDATSLGSTSTVHLSDGSEMHEIKLNE